MTNLQSMLCSTSYSETYVFISLIRPQVTPPADHNVKGCDLTKMHIPLHVTQRPDRQKVLLFSDSYKLSTQMDSERTQKTMFFSISITRWQSGSSEPVLLWFQQFHVCFSPNLLVLHRQIHYYRQICTVMDNNNIFFTL